MIAHDKPYLPLIVEALMAGPIAMQPDDGLPLDGILEYAAYLANAPVIQREFLPAATNRRRALPNIHEQAINFKIPVKRIGHKDDPDWHWSASWAEFPDGYELDRTHWNKRTDFSKPGLWPHVDWQGKSEKVNVASGRSKGYHMPMTLVVAPRVRWYAMGCPERIAGLLTRITHLGHKRGQGWGEVARWSIRRSARDYSRWRDGRPMRVLPDRKGSYQRRFCGLRPPYWHRQNQGDYIVPDPRPAPGLVAT